ncbi:MAG: hypothetical protein AAF215_21525 [Cyanobacteria bacterium P01_A01_bin.123]
MKLIYTFSTLLSVSLLSMKVVSPAWAELPPQKVQVIVQLDSEASEIAPPIAVADIQQINREVENLIAQGDVEGVLQYMAPFVISETITESSNGFESVYIEGIEQHREVLTNFFNETETEENSEVQEISQRETIRVTPDGQLATVTVSTITEVTTDEELRLITTTDTIRFARVQGQIKVIFYTTDSQIISHDL